MVRALLMNLDAVTNLCETQQHFKLRHSCSFLSIPHGKTSLPRQLGTSPSSKHHYLIVYGIGLPTDARSDDVSKFFEGYGRIIDCRVMTGSFQYEIQLMFESRTHP
jgi:hypothetical protein